MSDNHVVLETEDLNRAKAMRAALYNKFSGKRLWVCVLKGKVNLVTVGNIWGSRLSDDEAMGAT